MVAAHPLPPSNEAAKQAWVAQKLRELTPEERTAYENDSFFRSFVHMCLDDEWEVPGAVARSIEVRRMYGTDVERELADLEAGRHPYQQHP